MNPKHQAKHYETLIDKELEKRQPAVLDQNMKVVVYLSVCVPQTLMVEIRQPYLNSGWKNVTFDNVSNGRESGCAVSLEKDQKGI